MKAQEWFCAFSSVGAPARPPRVRCRRVCVLQALSYVGNAQRVAAGELVNAAVLEPDLTPSQAVLHALQL